MSTVEITTRLTELEAVIDRGMQTFVEVGQALAEIRDSALYKDSHATFEDYCRERWEFVGSRARQMIRAAEVAVIASGTNVPPISEFVARELSPLREQPEKLQAAWTEAVEINGDKPTAAAVREVVNQYRDDPKPKPELKYGACPTCGQRVRADQPLRGTR